MNFEKKKQLITIISRLRLSHNIIWALRARGFTTIPTQWGIKSLISYTRNVVVCQIHLTRRGSSHVRFGNWPGQRSIGYRKAIPISVAGALGTQRRGENADVKKQFRGFPPIDFSPPRTQLIELYAEPLRFGESRPKSSISQRITGVYFK